MAHAGSPKHARIILFLFLRTKSTACTETTLDKDIKEAPRAWGEEHSREDEGVTPNPLLSRPAPVSTHTSSGHHYGAQALSVKSMAMKIFYYQKTAYQ